jgi:hypothetical protein
MSRIIERRNPKPPINVPSLVQKPRLTAGGGLRGTASRDAPKRIFVDDTVGPADRALGDRLSDEERPGTPPPNSPEHRSGGRGQIPVSASKPRNLPRFRQTCCVGPARNHPALPAPGRSSRAPRWPGPHHLGLDTPISRRKHHGTCSPQARTQTLDAPPPGPGGRRAVCARRSPHRLRTARSGSGVVPTWVPI